MALLLRGNGIAIGLEAPTCGAVGHRNLDAIIVLAFFFRKWPKPTKEEALVELVLGMPIGYFTEILKRTIYDREGVAEGERRLE